MSKVEIADIFREALNTGGLNASPEQWKVVNAIINCRTSALGGHIYRCTDCGKEHPRYNSCRNRHCPKCQGGASAKWLDARMQELLPVPYFHLVFTIPHELNPIILQNKAELLNILFRSVTKTLIDVAKRRLNGELGFFSVLHSWGQKMEFHPHIHCVVPGAIIEKNDTVKNTKENYLLPKNVLSPVFRAVFIKALVRAYKKNHLEFHGKAAKFSSATNFFQLIKLVKSKHWLVYAKKPFSGPETVLKYLSRYTHRVAISNSRIINSQNATVTFSHKDYADDHKVKHFTIATHEFIRRFLLHTLPHQFVRIRHCGFLANGKRTKAILKIKNSFKITTIITTKPCLPPTCPHCGSDKIQLLDQIPKLFQGAKAHSSKILPLVA